MSSSSVSGSTFDSTKYSVITSIKASLSAAPRLGRRAISSEEDMAQDQRSEERSGYETSGYRETFAYRLMVPFGVHGHIYYLQLLFHHVE